MSTATLSRDEALNRVGLVDGWLTRSEAATLYDLAKNAKGPIIEIGSFHGRSTTALALGSMAGSGQPVYAIDPFIGPRQSDRQTAKGVKSSDVACSPEILRANLDKAGVNGLVKIVAKTAAEAADEVPANCAVLFVDGCHEYEAVKKDIENYVPKIIPGGSVLFHDVVPADQGVVQAVEELMMNRAGWQVRGRIDSAVQFDHMEIPVRSVYLACPGRGYEWGVIKGIMQSSSRHKVNARNNGNGWDDFNFLLSQALNDFEAGEVTHFVMLHSDIVPCPLWIDILLAEIDTLEADMVSVAVPIKDMRGVTSCGIGDTSNSWGAFRRYTMRELIDMPPTFSLADTPYPDKYLLHNTGCFVIDLRRPLFREVDEHGFLKAWFDFPTRITRGPDGKWINLRESEDWFFSRKLAELGAKTYVTRKVSLAHQGIVGFGNDEAWGDWKNGDEGTKARWEKAGVPINS